MAADEAETESESESEPGEQLDLLDVEPEVAKPIKAAARRYKKHQKARMAALALEIKAKDEIKALVHEAGIKADAAGVIEFRLDGMTIKITPRDELVRVKTDDDDGDAAGAD